MELARKSWKQGGSTEGNPAPKTPTTSGEKAEWRVHDCMGKEFRPNLMTSVELVSLVCSTFTMHCNCGQYQQGAADFNPWVCTFGSHNCMIFEAFWGKHLDKVLFKRPSVKSQLTLVHDSDTKQIADFAPVAASSQREWRVHASLAQNLSPQQIYDTFYTEKSCYVKTLPK